MTSSFLSAEFFLIALSAALWLRLARGWARRLGFTALCLFFASGFLDRTGLVSTLLFCTAGYGWALAARRHRSLATIGVAVMTTAFVFMRGYSFLELFVGEILLTDALATAGLSFLFFKILHVIIDSAAGTIGELRFINYLNYCLNFTTFLLGPIQRYQHFEAQWEGRERAIEPGFEAHLDAGNRVLRGLVKKFILAEVVAKWALLPGAEIGSMATSEILLGTYVFYLYLYFDFSGYCDIVIGVGCLMGVRPPENFRFPFLSPNVTQFWLRVHGSLTHWLTDYVFNPSFAAMLRSRWLGPLPLLAGSLAMMITMLICGLWHGTTSNFVLFGLVHGLYLVGFRVFEKLMTRSLGRRGLRSLRAHPAWIGLATFITFNLTALAYLFFVLDTEQLGHLLERMIPG